VTDSIDNLFNRLTIEEKAQLCTGKDFWRLHGIERLGLPSIMVTDGPHGVRKQIGESDHVGMLSSTPATCFPTASGLAASWNVDLIERVGVALAHECLAQQVSVLLGPGANIKRHALGGRNFEYFSEDPYLTGAMASAWICGLQSQNVGASLKHYALNNQERGRMVTDVVTDERTLREIYLPGWEACMGGDQPWTVMCAYNKFRGTYLAENEYLLKKVLRDEWGFRGVVITDWGANHKRVDGVKNGQSLEMPSTGGANAKKILAALSSGSMSEAELDESVRPVVELIAKSAQALDPHAQVDLDANHNLARQAAEEACVLLKNENEILPLSQTHGVLVVGSLAQRTRYQGTGSSQINPTQLEQPLDEIRAIAGDSTVFAEGYRLSGKEDPDLRSEAVALAADAERIVVVIGLTPEYESEGFDRTHMRLPSNQLQLVEALEPYHDRTVIVLQNGAPVELPFKDSVAAILEAYLGGQAGASALARHLFGLTNPSGKLAETLAEKCEDLPSNTWFPGEYRQAQYREGIWVGYRYFDTTNKAVAFPFGHGLSYTRFELSDLDVQVKADRVEFSLTVKNVGALAGAETIQVYVGQQNASVPRPAREMKGFHKVFLQPGESQTVRLELGARAFAFWCVEEHKWVVEKDQFRIDVGVSIADIRLSELVELPEGRPIGNRDEALTPYFSPSELEFSDDVFERLLGHPIPKPLTVKPFQMNSTLLELRSNWLGRLLHWLMLRQIEKLLVGDDVDDVDESRTAMMLAVVNESPVRSLVMLSQGRVKEAAVQRLIHAMNNNWWRALTGGPTRSE
jgi:beta-glucosidase